jgi:DNA-binding NtrC family response regulator
MEDTPVPPPLPELSSPVAAQVELFAPQEQPIVITGPIGVGKTWLAHFIHQRSARKGAFVPVPLTSLQQGFEHVTLAGHDKGAYTGAHQRRPGLLAEANGGTLFLDEIGDASTEGQRLLLELLTERGLRRLGEERRVRYDLRFILATHVDLDAAVEAKAFREDLLSRLGNCWIDLAPLRERPEEIPALVHHYLGRTRAERGLPLLQVAPELLGALVAAPWVYNIRSLVNECQSLAAFTPADRVLRVEHLSRRFWVEVRRHLRSLSAPDERMTRALLITAGHRGMAAELLEVSERTVYRQSTGHPERKSSRSRPAPAVVPDLPKVDGSGPVSGSAA